MGVGELLLSLAEGVHEEPPFGTFIRTLVSETNARRGLLVLTLPHRDPLTVNSAAPRAVGEPPLDLPLFERLELRPVGTLRPGRVYALEELLDFEIAGRPNIQRAALSDLGVRYARCMRVTVGAVNGYILLVREHDDFPASAAATLSTIAPHLTAALRMLAVVAEQRTRTALAENTLARLGIGQLAFDASGRVLAADPVAEASLSFAREPGSSRRLQLLPDALRALEAACADLAGGRIEASTIRIGDHHLLLRRWNASAVIGSLRIARREDPRSAVPVVASTLGLSRREAALAHALTLGETIDEAGRRMRLTRETARNYSKRIYAKSGARGQADLVRLVLTGLAPLS